MVVLFHSYVSSGTGENLKWQISPTIRQFVFFFFWDCFIHSQ
jgi:hypothetical protein